VYVNDPTERLFKKNRGELVGRSIWDVLPKNVQSMLDFYYNKALSDGEPSMYDNLKLFNRRCIINFYPARNGVTVFLQDITSKWQTEELYRLALFLLDRLNETVFLVRFDGRLFHVNDETSRMLGYTRDELIHMKLFDVDTNLTAEEWQDEFNSIKERKQAVFESTYKAKDGMLIPVEVSVNFIELYGNEYYCVAARDITERKLAEAILEKYRLFSETTRDIVLFIRRDGRILEANEAAVKAYGHSYNELLSLSIFDLRASDPGYLVEEQMERAFNEGILFETIHRRKDGSTFPVEVSSDGKVISGQKVLLSIVRDITERKRAEEALRESEEKYRIVADNTYDWEFWQDADGIFLYSSPSCRQITGYSVEEFIGDPDLYFKIILDEDLPAFRKHHFEEARRGKSGELEYRIITKDGKVKWIHHACLPVLEKGRFIGTRGSNRDITERKKAEEKLRESEANLSRAQSIAHIGSYNWDIVKNNVYRSDEMYRILGYEPRGLGPTYEAYMGAVHPEDRDSFNRSIQDALNNIKPHRMDYRIIRPDGTVRFIHGEAEVETDGSGKPVRLIGTIHDITERKLAEIEFQKAKALVEMYNDLLGHDINNMNQVGIGYLELALNTPGLNRDIKKLLQKPLEALQNSSNLIENVKKLQHIRSGEVRHKKMDVNQVLLDVERAYSNVSDRDIVINCSPMPGCIVMANEILIDVFSNLVGNAIKHSTGALVVGMGVSRVIENGREYCRAHVEDNGPGIPDSVKDRLFTRFQRGDTKASGKGLGLFIVKTLVEDYGGRVWVEDRVAGDHRKGARFVVMLPAVEK
jgi:PAS domain S-box-containing protein